MSSRIPYGNEVTDERLRQIERAEAVLRDLGFRIFRVRHHDDTGPPRDRESRDAARARSGRERPAGVRTSKRSGYQYVSLDLQGYRLGSLNEALRLRPVS